MEPGFEGREHDLGMRPGRRGDHDRVQPAFVEQPAIVGVEAGDGVAGAERLADGGARLGQPGQLEEIAAGGEVVEVHRLGDEAAPDDADPQPQASTRVATFRNASAISSRSCSSQSGETST